MLYLSNMKKSLNELAVETLSQLLALPDEEFFAFFDKIKPSDLGPVLEYSGMFEQAAQESEIVFGQKPSQNKNLV